LIDVEKVEKSRGFHFFERSLKFWESGNASSPTYRQAGTPSVPEGGETRAERQKQPPPGQLLLKIRRRVKCEQPERQS
jgi:hypothetical protein